MRVLLDTHILLWQFLGDPRFSGGIRDIIFDQSIDLIVSDVSVWEVAIKFQAGKLPVPVSDFEREIDNHGFSRLSINRQHLARVSELPRLHGDPFDHLLIAQSMIEDSPILTADEKFKSYPVKLALL